MKGERKEQSRAHSMVETATNTGIGYVVAVFSQMIIFPMFDIHVDRHENIVIAFLFTVISLVRGYCVRRWFNRL